MAAEPIVNKSSDLWAQLRVCGLPEPEKATWWERGYDTYMPKLTGHILSLDLSDTDIKLPPLIEKDHRVKFDEFGQKTYEYGVGMTKKYLQDILTKRCFEKSDTACILALLMRLRQVCIASSLWFSIANEKSKKQIKHFEKDVSSEDDEEEDDDEMDEDMNIEDMLEGFDKNLIGFFENEDVKKWMGDMEGSAGKSSPKMLEASRIISEEVAPDDKVIVFSSFKSALKLLEKRLSDDGIYSVTLDGNVSTLDRQKVLDQFASDTTVKVLLVTTKVGGFGLNITCANVVIFMDRWWNAVSEIQARSRVYRLGQKKEVVVHHLIAQKNPLFSKNRDDDDLGTVEDKILEMCQRKDEMSKQVFGFAGRKKDTMSKTERLINML